MKWCSFWTGITP